MSVDTWKIIACQFWKYDSYQLFHLYPHNYHIPETFVNKGNDRISTFNGIQPWLKKYSFLLLRVC